MIDEIMELIWQKVQDLKLVWNFIWKQAKKFLQYEKTLFTTHLKDWTYLDIIAGCVSILGGLFAFVSLLMLSFEIGIFWTITLSISILLYKFANTGSRDFRLDNEDKMLLKAVSGLFLIITLFQLIFKFT